MTPPQAPTAPPALPQTIARELAPLGLPAAAPALTPQATAAAAKKSHRIPNFSVPHQEQTNWCWAAVSVGVAARVGSAWQQCHLVSLELGKTCCPTGTNSGTCNIPYYLDRALARVGRLNTVVGGAANLTAQVAPEVDANRPVGVRIGWAGGGGHFVAIAGYSTVGGTFVDVEDPWTGPATVAYTALRTAYQGSGTWTHTYWTT